jgi:hypothetical protein
VSTIGWEKRHNARLANRSRDDFVQLMGKLDLPKPKLIDVAVPANQNLACRTAADGAGGGHLPLRKGRSAARPCGCCPPPYLASAPPCLFQQP